MRRLISMPIIPLFIISLYYELKERRLQGNGIVYSLIITFMAIFVYAVLYPAFKAILVQSLPGLGEVESLIIIILPIAILLSVLWGVTWLIQPRKA